MMNYCFFETASKAFGIFRKTPENQINSIVKKAYELLTTEYDNLECQGMNYPLVDVFHAVLYILWLETKIDSYDEYIYGKPLNADSLGEVHGEYAVYYTFDRSFKKFSSDVPRVQYFSKLFFIIKEKRFLVENIYISSYERFSEMLEEGTQFNFVFIPSGKNLALDNIDEERPNFFLQGENPMDLRYINSLKLAKEGHPCIIFSSEMMGSEMLDNSIIEAFDEEDAIAIAAPSYHQKDENGFVNKSLVLYYKDHSYEETYVGKGEKFLKYNKELKLDECMERITSNPHFVLFHIREIGQILFVICKDALSNNFEELIETICPSIVIVMAYTEDYKAFRKNMGSLAHCGRLGILANACSACGASNEDSPLLIYEYDYMNMNKKDDIYIQTKMCQTCTKNCCYFEIQIIKRKDGSYKVNSINQIKN